MVVGPLAVAAVCCGPAPYCSDSSVRLIWVSSTTRCHALVATFHFSPTFILLCITFGVVRSLSSQVGLPWFIPPRGILL